MTYLMKTAATRNLICLLLTLFLLIPFQASLRAAEPPVIKEQTEYILIINSYAESSDWSNNLIRPIYESILVNKYPLTAYTEHMNMLMIENDEQLKDYKEFLFSKYKETTPKVIILLGNSPWALLKEELEARWPNIPVILCAEKDYMGPKEAYLNKSAIHKVEQIALKDYQTTMKVSVLYLPYYIKENVELLKRMLPQMKKIIFLSDKRYISAQNRAELEEVIQRDYPYLQISFLISEDITMNSLNDSLRFTEPQTGILFFSWYKKIALSGNTILSTNDYKMFSRYTDAPIFTLDDIESANTGMLGGYYHHTKQIGNAVSKLLKDVLTGRSIGAYTLEKFENPTSVFNYPVFMSKGLSIGACPENAFFYQKPLSFWEQYKYQIVTITFLILLIFFYMMMKIRIMNHTKTEQESQIKLIKNYGSLFTNMPIAYSKQQLVFNEQGEITDYEVLEVNPCYENHFFAKELILDRRGSELEGASFRDHIHLYRLAMNDRKAITVQYYHQLTGKYFSMIIAPSQVEGNVDLFYVDNTELSQTQQLLRTVNHKLSMALDVANITPWKWNLEEKTIMCDVNRAIEFNSESSSTNVEEQLSVAESLYFAKICKRDLNRVKQAYQDLIEGKVTKIKEEYRVFVHNEHKNTYEWVEAQAVVDKRDEQGKPMSLIGSSQVISERKKMEEDLVDAKEKAEESNRLKSAFLANMSHEIRTPLNAIVGFSEVLASAEREDEKHEYVSIIENNNTLLLQLISDILDLSKIEAGTLEFVETEVNIDKLFTELETSARIKTNNNTVRIIYEKGMPDCCILTEKNRLTQVTMNLINNAIKFTQEGTIHFGYCLKEDNFLHFYITDTGCGIPENKLQSVFGRFVKLNNFAQGTGLGLSICQTIIHHLGGEIGVTSEEGKGSTFWFTIPYCPVTIVEQPMIAYEPQIIEKNKLTVLIAEDNASNFKLFETILKGEYRIIHAADGEEAVALFKQHQPHIILMDINMPKMNGYEATKAIRELSTRVPIIAVTAYAYASDEQKILESGFNGYAAKPINSQILKLQMINLLKRQLIFM